MNRSRRSRKKSKSRGGGGGGTGGEEEEEQQQLQQEGGSLTGLRRAHCRLKGVCDGADGFVTSRDEEIRVAPALAAARKVSFKHGQRYTNLCPVF